MFRTTHALSPTGALAPGRPGLATTSVLLVVRPWMVVSVLLALISSQLFYVFLPYRRRTYPGVLLLTGLGFGFGQLWDYLGLPSTRIGEANLLPGLPLAAVLQFLAPWVLIRLPKREP